MLFFKSFLLAMLSQLDSNVGQVVKSLKERGMWNDTVLVFISDNGGKLGPSGNAPFRGGKFSYFEGGLRVVNFVSGGAFPSSRMGTTWNGLVHIADWLPTLVEGVAGATIDNGAAPVNVTGFNQWPALLSGNLAMSPRTSVVFQVANRYHAGVSAMRSGPLKLIQGGNPGDSRLLEWPKNSSTPIAFGATGGIRNGHHCYAARGDEPQKGEILCSPFCLFDVVQDPSESNNLAGDPKYASTVKSMQAYLAKQAQTAMPPYFIGGSNATNPPFPNLWKNVCHNAKKTGFLQPGDWTQ